MKELELCINPVEVYKAPDIPMFGDNKPALLRQLPKRWQKNAKVIACVGVIGVFTLSGCASPFSQNLGNTGKEQMLYSGYSEEELVIRTHVGGGGPSFYIVHLTEQEAFGIIRARLEKAGLNFSATPPKYTLGEDGEIAIDLFDERRGVAVTNLSWEQSHRRFSPQERGIAMRVEEWLSEEISDGGIVVGAFYNPSKWLGPEYSSRENRLIKNETPTSYEVESEARPFLRERMISQADAFIVFLQSEGILESLHEIKVMINGELIELDLLPVILNDQVMVPAPAIFEALGMEVELDHRGVLATKPGFSISMNLDWGRYSMMVNNSWVTIDTPAIMFNNKVLVPLQYVAEAIGASVEWDKDMTTIKVSTNSI